MQYTAWGPACHRDRPGLNSRRWRAWPPRSCWRRCRIFDFGISNTLSRYKDFIQLFRIGQLHFMYTRITGSSTVHIHTGIFQTDPVAVSQIMADTAIIFPGIFTHGITQNIVFIGPAINKIPVSIPPIISITQLQTHIPATVTAKQLREIHTDTAGMLTGEPAG